MPTNEMTIRLGTRGSQLAMWQSHWVKSKLEQLGVSVQLITIKTEGDTTQGSLAQIGGQGLFTKRIQTALLDNKIDLAVHSLKDLPTQDIPGLAIAAVPERENCFDALVSNKHSSIDELPENAVVGTGSVRRAAQLLHLRSDLDIRDIRGNVDSRLRKLDEGQYDAIILASAGLIRLGWKNRIAFQFDESNLMPAVGQGALGLETRSNDESTKAIVQRLNHANSFYRAMSERSLLKKLFAGCLAPVGSFTTITNEQLKIEGVVLSRDGQERIHAEVSGPMKTAIELGQAIGQTLIDRGADKLLRRDS